MNQFRLLDGGMGQELVKRTQRPISPLWSTEILNHEPHLVVDVHAEYLAAGADILTLASYSITPGRLVEAGMPDALEALIDRSIDCARKAIQRSATHKTSAQRTPQIAGSIGPLTRSYQADRVFEAERCADEYTQIASCFSGKVDLVIIETVTTLTELEAASTACAQAGLTTWVAFSVSETDGTKLRGGADLRSSAERAVALGAQAVLINCSTPEATSAGVRSLQGLTVPVGAYANGFVDAEADLAGLNTVDGMRVREDLSPAAYATFAQQWLGDGASIVGGCCEVGPEHITQLNQLRG